MWRLWGSISLAPKPMYGPPPYTPTLNQTVARQPHAEVHGRLNGSEWRKRLATLSGSLPRRASSAPRRAPNCAFDPQRPPFLTSRLDGRSNRAPYINLPYGWSICFTNVSMGLESFSLDRRNRSRDRRRTWLTFVTRRACDYHLAEGPMIPDDGGLSINTCGRRSE
jgi:hypothetical protein